MNTVRSSYIGNAFHKLTSVIGVKNGFQWTVLRAAHTLSTKTRRMELALIAMTVIGIVNCVFDTSCARADGLDDIRKFRVLKVAVPVDFPPFGTVDSDLRLQGCDIDMARLIADGLGVKIELVPVTSANRIPFLTTRKVHLVVSSLGRTSDREQVIDFSIAYAPFFSGVFGSAGQKVSSVQDLAGKTISVTRGAIEDLEITKIAPSTATIKRFEDNSGTIMAFLSGQVELIATGNIVAASILAKNPQIRPEVKFLIKNSPCHVGLNKGDTRLLKAVNAIIARAKADGSLNAIARKWLNAELPQDL
jgi:polar amino acid transport system substrate-binding protein